MDERVDKLNKADYEHRLMVKAVWYYYIENYTQQNISLAGCEPLQSDRPAGAGPPGRGHSV